MLKRARRTAEGVGRPAALGSGDSLALPIPSFPEPPLGVASATGGERERGGEHGGGATRLCNRATATRWSLNIAGEAPAVTLSCTASTACCDQSSDTSASSVTLQPDTLRSGKVFPGLPGVPGVDGVAVVLVPAAAAGEALRPTAWTVWAMIASSAATLRSEAISARSAAMRRSASSVSMVAARSRANASPAFGKPFIVVRRPGEGGGTGSLFFASAAAAGGAAPGRGVLSVCSLAAWAFFHFIACIFVRPAGAPATGADDAAGGPGGAPMAGAAWSFFHFIACIFVRPDGGCGKLAPSEPHGLS